MSSTKKDKCYLCQQLRAAEQYCSHPHCPRQPKSANQTQAIGPVATKPVEIVEDNSAASLLIAQINPPYEG